MKTKQNMTSESLSHIFFFRYHPFLLPFLKSPGTLYALQVTFSIVMGVKLLFHIFC